MLEGQTKIDRWYVLFLLLAELKRQRIADQQMLEKPLHRTDN